MMEVFPRVGLKLKISLMREVLPRVGLKFKICLASRRVFPTRFVQNFLRHKRIGGLTLCTKRKKFGNSPSNNPTCLKRDKMYRGEYLVGTGNCYCCGKEGHKFEILLM